MSKIMQDEYTEFLSVSGTAPGGTAISFNQILKVKNMVENRKQIVYNVTTFLSPNRNSTRIKGI
jgi:hypothetical protein